MKGKLTFAVCHITSCLISLLSQVLYPMKYSNIIAISTVENGLDFLVQFPMSFSSLRGCCYFNAEVTCATKDLHSGAFGGTM